jgi:hypothetical protein
VAAAVPDHVVVVQHQDNRLRQRGQLVDQQRQQRSGEIRRPGPDRGQQVTGTELRAGPLHRAHDMPPQPAGIVIAGIERDPRERPALGRARAPLRDQSGLAEPRRRVNQDEPGGNARQITDELLPLHPLPPRRGSMQFRLDRRIQTHPPRLRGCDGQRCLLRHRLFRHGMFHRSPLQPAIPPTRNSPYKGPATIPVPGVRRTYRRIGPLRGGVESVCATSTLSAIACILIGCGSSGVRTREGI